MKPLNFDLLRTTFQRDFLYGLILIIPLVVTIWILIFSISLFTGPVSRLFGQTIHPVIAFCLSIGFIFLVGFFARNLIGKAIITSLETWMGRIPIIRTVYYSVKQIVSSFTIQKKRLLSSVLIEYPRKGVWAMGFITNENVSGLKDKDGQSIGLDKCAVFVPTTPNPTSGVFLYVPESDLIRLDMSVEQSVKVLISAGVLSP